MVTVATDRPVHRCAPFLQLVVTIFMSVACSTFAGCGSSTAAGNGPAGPDSGSSLDSAVSTQSADCTLPWSNPGKVENPTVMLKPADAGTTGHMFGRSAPASLAAYNYLEYEVMFQGTSPAYGTRMVVHRPADSSKYNGTVIVEWYNVSGQLDFAPEWAWNRNYFMREGYVHIAVSAQAVGASALKRFDPVRYASINLPSDNDSNAIFSQAGVAIRLQSDLILGKCMPVHAMIGAGQSQSCFKLSSYINSAQPVDKVYDAHVCHSGLEIASNDPSVPVFEIFTMTEGNGRLPDGPNMVKWVVAGATHSDNTLATVGEEAGADLASIAGAPTGMTAMCTEPGNNFPSYRVYSAAFDWMNKWVRMGMRPPAGAPFTGMDDANGNVLGGIRLPEIDVATAAYTTGNSAVAGTDPISAMACTLGGSATPFTPDKLLQLYPTHADYVQKYTQAADKALAGGFLLKADHDTGIQDAMNGPIPK
jgi:Alpha/beta hydrolase domain